MGVITIVNLKCGGCANTITKHLRKHGLTNAHVDIATSTVSFEGDERKAKKLLSKLGYPPAGSPTANSLLKKAASFVSCMKGKRKE
ncbi:heavy-metal-associated domain-containing protein [Candidatus Woesearchaeota archaeon]|nr:heavy-metal-associated domain-containing protein [Candidatus Woesearchaeota archaeon]